MNIKNFFKFFIYEVFYKIRYGWNTWHAMASTVSSSIYYSDRLHLKLEVLLVAMVSVFWGGGMMDVWYLEYLEQPLAGTPLCDRHGLMGGCGVVSWHQNMHTVLAWASNIIAVIKLLS